MYLISLLQSPLFPPLALVAVALAGYALRAPRRGKPQPHVAAPERLDDAETKRSIDAGLEAKKDKEMARAAWLFERGSLRVKAAECYEAAGDPLYAATLYRGGGDQRRAGELFRRHGYPVEAAASYEAGRRFGDAAVIWALLGDLPRAARLFVVARRPSDAADLYARMGMFHQAGRLYMAAGKPSRAADAFEQMLASLGRTQLEVDPQIGVLLEKEGRIDAAIQLLEAVGEVMQALRTAIRHRREEDARRIYLDYREILAAPLLKGATDGKLSAKVLADLFEAADDSVAAARMATLLGQTRRAARLYESAGQDALAGEAWLSSEEPRDAALAFERAGQFDRAAALFEELGEDVRAAHCYKLAGDFVAAARIHERAGEAADAIAAYQQVHSSDPGWHEARLRLARLLAAASRWDLAIDAFVDALSSRPPGSAELDDLVALARLLEGRQRFGESAACWAAIGRLDARSVEVDENYARMRDAAVREGQQVPPSFPYREADAGSSGAFGGGVGDVAGVSGVGDVAAAATPGIVGGTAAGGPAGGEAFAPPGIAAAPGETDAAPAAAGLDAPGDAAAEEGSLPDWPQAIAADEDARVSFEGFLDGATDDDLARSLGQRSGAPAGGLDDGQVSLVMGQLPPGVDGTEWQDWASGVEPEAGDEGGAAQLPGLEGIDDAELPGAFGSASADGSADELSHDTEELLAAAGLGDDLVRDSAGGFDASAFGDAVAGGPVEPFGGAADLSDFGFDTRDVDALDDEPSEPSSRTTSDASAASGSPLLPDGPLERFALFAALEPAHRAEIAAELRLREALPGEGLLVGDDEDDGLLLLVDGTVELQGGPEGSLSVNAPALVGVPMLLEGELPPLRARAVSAARAWVLSRAGARRLAERDRAAAIQLARALRARGRGDV